MICCFDVADTQSGKSVESSVKGWLPNPSADNDVFDYGAELTIPNDFGNPGAIIITNLHYKEFYLVQIVVHGFASGPVAFPANSWIHSHNDNYDSRIIFRNQVILFFFPTCSVFLCNCLLKLKTELVCCVT